ncbi:MAG: RraA family protein [Pseudomonadota bacterium]
MTIDAAALNLLRRYDTPTICNALEVVAPERRTTGFTSRSFVCVDPSLPPIVGLVRTATIRASAPSPLDAAMARAERIAYYEYVAAAELPTVTVIQDLDDEPGFGAFWGEVNSHLHRGLGVLGCVTNGSFRDVADWAPDFQMLGGMLAPSHAWVYVETVGADVTVHGMTARHDDVIHADRHGAVIVPAEVVAQIPEAVAGIARRERVLIEASKQASFNVVKLKAAMAEADEIH